MTEVARLEEPARKPGATTNAAVIACCGQAAGPRSRAGHGLGSLRDRPPDALDAALARAVTERGNPMWRETNARVDGFTGSAPALQRVVSAGAFATNTPSTHSASGQYILTDSGLLWVRTGAAAPRACVQAMGRARKHAGVTYRRYEPAWSVVTDCLHTAEEVMHGTELALGAVRSTVTIGAATEDFGVDDASNRALAVRATTAPHALNAAAAPGVGEAFVIVGSPGDLHPYHAAGVIAADTDVVTMEIFATDQDAASRNADARFKMYSTSGAATFHATWAATFTDPRTIVIRPK